MRGTTEDSVSAEEKGMTQDGQLYKHKGHARRWEEEGERNTAVGGAIPDQGHRGQELLKGAVKPVLCPNPRHSF
jgi:hypothetical protein